MRLKDKINFKMYANQNSSLRAYIFSYPAAKEFSKTNK